MGLTTSSIVFIILSLTAVVRCDLPHYAKAKSFITALYECGEYLETDNVTLDQYIYYGYPSVPEMKRLVHCAMVNVGAWNDNIGVRQNVISYYFKPNAMDSEYVERTQCCLDKICVAESCDQNNRAFETFSCYYRQYGRLIKDEVFVPLESLEFIQLFSFIKLALDICPEKLAQFARGDFLDDPLFKPVLFIVSLRFGGFSWENGLLLDVFYQQFGVSKLISPCTKKCVADVSARYCTVDKQELVYQVYKQCLHTLLDSSLQTAFQAMLSDSPCVQVGFTL
ncbi:general odorant-binding protein 45-like [Armigeres subalbatus]|uniref:general odorant-binding protein 45-like n=1 Tax=Armigeres subalbatus TaxID=124917 RepID=UPI002ED2FE1F